MCLLQSVQCSVLQCISKGGLGVRRASDLALPAFLASCYGTHDLVSSLLPPVELGNDPLQREALDLWEANTTCPLPPEELRGRQRRWDELFTQKTHEDLLEGATDSITRAASCQQLLRSQEPG